MEPNGCVSVTRLTVGGVEVWWTDLDRFSEQTAAGSQWLSADERARAERFVFQVHRERFVRCRGWLRQLLAGYVGQPPEALKFEYGPYGKPALVDCAEGHQLHFNLAHSENLAAMAVSRVGPVGIDVEQVRELADWPGIVQEHFSEQERAALFALPESERLIAFYRVWSRKEAALKAAGLGMGAGLSMWNAGLAGHACIPAGPTGCGTDFGSGWEVWDLELPPSFAGALAVSDRSLVGDMRGFHGPFSKAQSERSLLEMDPALPKNGGQPAVDAPARRGAFGTSGVWESAPHGAAAPGGLGGHARATRAASPPAVPPTPVGIGLRPPSLLIGDLKTDRLRRYKLEPLKAGGGGGRCVCRVALSFQWVRRER